MCTGLERFQNSDGVRQTSVKLRLIALSQTGLRNPGTLLSMALGLKMGECLKTRYSALFPRTWDFGVLGISAYSIHQCIPNIFLKKIGRVLVNLQE
jgi:hypothetical protein